MKVTITLVRLGEASIECNDACGSWHLELEVGIVRDRHELRERWSSQYGVVLRLPVEYFKLKDIPCKVASVAKDKFELDDSKGGGRFSWYYSV